jgi:hypothetical protein
MAPVQGMLTGRVRQGQQADRRHAALLKAGLPGRAG